MSGTHGIRKEIVRSAVPIDDLSPYPGNARRGNVDEIVKSLEAHGQYRPVLAQRDGKVVLAGNHTLQAARELGWTHLAVTWLDVDDDQARRIVLVDNRTNDLASYDDQALVDLLQEAAAHDREFEGTGFDEDDYDRLLEKLEPDDDGPASDDEPPAEPEVFGVAVACGNEEQRDGLMERLRELGYEPKILNGRWGDLKG